MNNDLQSFLDKKVAQYNQPQFIAADPISIPHLFTKKQDIEIAGFFAAIFAWGNRTTIINKSKELMVFMHQEPYQFILHHSDNDLKTLLQFKHRTFNVTDLLYFVYFLKHHYRHHQSLETAFIPNNDGPVVIEDSLNYFFGYFFSLDGAPERTKKHIAAPFKGSTCKRLNMFLRWMVRSDDHGVDFGIWKGKKPAELICPVDVHVARVARHLHLITRMQTDWLAATELTENLKTFDAADPVKYDFALFSLGVEEKF
ncbi:MAG TPA: TIGR02757 family protein [Flavisolibacter sp.]|nr:TIGR02757 family protein [Flavisolibacter sp.]